MKWVLWGIGIVVFILCIWLAVQIVEGINEVGLKGILETLWYGNEK